METTPLKIEPQQTATGSRTGERFYDVNLKHTDADAETATRLGGDDGMALRQEFQESMDIFIVDDISRNGQNEEQLLKAADKALYRAKDAGRNRVVCAGK